MKVEKISTIISLCIVWTGCVKEIARSGTSPRSAHDPESAPPAIEAVAPATREGWHQFEFNGLSFSAPPGMTNVPVSGIDSVVGRWDSTNITVVFDFGPFARMTFGPEAKAIQVAGRAGRMATSVYKLERASELPDTIGLRFARFSNIGEVGVPNGPNGEFLRVTFYYKEPKDVTVMEAILDSIRY